MSETKLLPDSRQLAGRLYGLQEAAVIAGETSIGLAIYDRIKFIEANAEATPSLTPEQAAAHVLIGTVSPNDDGTWDVAFAPDNTTWVTVSPDQVPRAPRVGDTLIVLPPRVIGMDGAA